MEGGVASRWGDAWKVIECVCVWVRWGRFSTPVQVALMTEWVVKGGYPLTFS